jgi:CubicO group peptidase (beta-lactamase class C family)
MIISARPSELSLTNWDLGGRPSRWSYRHADVLFPTRRLIPALRSIGNEHPIRDDVPDDLRDELESGRIVAVTVVAAGHVLFRWPHESFPRHLLMSVSKVFASLAVGILVDRGALAYTDSIREHLPELGRQWTPCRVQHVLDMTSGVECPEVGDPGAYRDPKHPFYQFEASLGWRPATRPDSPYDLVRSYGRTGRPGSRYEYTSANTFLLAWLIEQITGMTYAEALQWLIWDRLTLADDSAICVNHNGVAVSHGGLIMSPDDLARFGTLFTPSPSPQHHALRVPDSYLEMLRMPREELITPTPMPPVPHPGGQWNLIHPNGDMFKSGFGGQGLYVSPTNDVVIAFCGVPDEQGRTHQLAGKCRRLTSWFASR